MNKLLTVLLGLGALACTSIVSFYVGAKAQAEGAVDVGKGNLSRVVERRDAWTPPDEDYSMQVLPSSLLSDDKYLGQQYVASTAPVISFSYDASYYALLPYRVDFEASSTDILGVSFVAYDLSSFVFSGGADVCSTLAVKLPFVALASIGSSTSKLMVLGNWYDSITRGTGIMSPSGGLYHDDGYYGYHEYESLRNPLPSDPTYTLSVSYPSYLEYLSTTLDVFLYGYGSNDGGYANGYDQGMTVGYQQGYADGSRAPSDEQAATLGGLFAAIVGVPINVLNGLSPFVVWNMPIVSIVITFLMLGIILMVVRKFVLR